MLCGKGRVRTQDLGYQSGAYDHCATRPVVQQYKLSRHYPTPPPAPPKGQYIAPSKLEAKSSDSERQLQRPPAKVLSNGQLMYHKAYNGLRPITYVDTRLYQGGRNDYIEAFHDNELIWLRLIRDLLNAHKIPRRNV